MSDIVQQIAKLTPVSMDKDALLFNAGRASVRTSSVIWKWACAVLAISQGVMITVWLTNRSLVTKLVISDLPSSEIPTVATNNDLASEQAEPVPLKTYSLTSPTFFSFSSDYAKPIRPDETKRENKPRFTPVKTPLEPREPIHTVNGQLINP